MDCFHNDWNSSIIHEPYVQNCSVPSRSRRSKILSHYSFASLLLQRIPFSNGYEQVSKPNGTLVNTKISGLSGCPFLWWNWFNDPLQSFCLLLCKWEDGEFPPHHTSTQEIGLLSLGKPSWCGSIEKTMSALGLIPKTGCPANVFLNTPKISDTLHKVPCFAG